MIIKCWNNGKHHIDGNGYGIKISVSDRDQYFDRDWKTIILALDGIFPKIEINIDKDSFWNKSCRELISVEIGKWLIKNKLAPWPEGNPPQLDLQKIGEREFLLKDPNQK